MTDKKKESRREKEIANAISYLESRISLPGCVWHEYDGVIRSTMRILWNIAQKEVHKKKCRSSRTQPIN